MKASPAATIDVERFILSRRDRWNRLGRLLDVAENAPERELGAERIQELVELYRSACSDLNEARSYTANPELLGRLNQLTGRAYRFVYRGTRSRPLRRSLTQLITSEIPAAFRRRKSYVLSAAGALLVGMLFGIVAVALDPANGQRLVPMQFFTERPSQRVQRIEQGDERIDSIEKAAYFGASLYTHNIKVSLLAFGLGALTFFGAYLLLFFNGVILGAIGTLYVLDGVPLFFFAWVGPHGGLEIPAIVFGAAAGLLAGEAFLFPGDLSRARSVRLAFPDIWRMILATAITLVLAGIVEGSFSQFSSKTFSYPVKIVVALLLFTSLISYLFLSRHDGGGESP
ncbi:MAG: stage II sporulation protein M [Thermoanaerobaculia bacterium]